MSAVPLLAHGQGASDSSLAPGVLLLVLVVAVVLMGVLHGRPSQARGQVGVLTRGAGRTVRGLLVAAAAWVFSWSGHVLAGAPPPLTAEVVAGMGVLAGVCCVASRVRWTGPRLLVATGTAEPAFHVLFEMSSAHGGAGPSAAVAAAGLLTDPVMLAGHAAAAVALAALLAHAESFAFVLAALLAAAVARWTAPVRPGPLLPAPTRHHSSDVRAAPRPSPVLLLSAPRRGPPRGTRVG